MRIAIIGAAGMLGHKLVHRLARDGKIGGKAISAIMRHDVVLAPPPPAGPFAIETHLGDLSEEGQMATHNNGRLAVLIDADNAQASVIQELLAEVSRYGTATIKRAYGDWTTTNLKGWKDVLHKMAIQPVQQFSYTSGKNATDSALIIDAMDVLHTGSLKGALQRFA